MILITLLAAAALAPNADEIVVVAQKMRFVEVDIRAPRRNKVLVIERCRVTRGSGNAEIDAVPCAAAAACLEGAPATRKLLQACVEERSQPAMDAIIARWRAARNAGS